MSNYPRKLTKYVMKFPKIDIKYDVQYPNDPLLQTYADELKQIATRGRDGIQTTQEALHELLRLQNLFFS